MVRSILFCFLMAVGFSLASAQSIEQHIQQHKAGEGDVTLHISSSVLQAMTKESTPVAEDKEEKPLEEQLKDLEAFRNAPKAKVQGFRVQLYGGSNSRASREAAQRANETAKRLFPEYPVYTHFESPRWVCKIGNFQDRAEANEVWKRAKENGFPQAIVVRDQILIAR